MDRPAIERVEVKGSSTSKVALRFVRGIILKVKTSALLAERARSEKRLPVSTMPDTKMSRVVP
jgi:hypothetical protein